MNVDRINQLADYIEGNGHPFSMQQWPFCNYGHLCRMIGKDMQMDPRLHVIEVLGINYPTALGLISGRDASREQAVATLRHLAKTGHLDWTVPVEKPLPASITDTLKGSEAAARILERV